MSVVVDASVWVSAADASDTFSASSRAFLQAVAQRRTSLIVPGHAHLELACALARRLRDAQAARTLAEGLLRSPHIKAVPIDAALLSEALEAGTNSFLRAGDALYVAAARSGRFELVSWDTELVQRGAALTPDAWLTAHQ
ncbi:MAG: PIN domain-containing protein [Armatimonadetes bacterium]|nr:PIN domain-containing protein [Armatimonadota bacterium]